MRSQRRASFAFAVVCRFVMSSLNISGRRIVEKQDVEDMIKAVDDGDGKLDFDEFVKLIQKH